MKKEYITPEFRPRKMAVEESLLAAISENGNTTTGYLTDEPIDDDDFDD
jgi:hypothetical protein